MLPRSRARRSNALFERAHDIGEVWPWPLLAKAERCGEISVGKKHLAHGVDLSLWRSKLSSVNTSLTVGSILGFHHLHQALGRHFFEGGVPNFAFYGQALRHRCALWQYSVEALIIPTCWEVDGAEMKCVRVNESCERCERKVGAVDRMRKQQ